MSGSTLSTKISPEKLNSLQKRYHVSLPKKEDKQTWMAMWADYTDDTPSPSKNVLEYTWKRLLESDHPLYGLFLHHKKDGKLVGFAHYILHPDTWHKGMSCYIEDCYILKEHRTSGAMFILFAALQHEFTQQKWDKVYWMTRSNNKTARRFYDRIVDRTDWIRYEVDTKTVSKK